MEEPTNVQVFNAEWDEEGVYVYQAFNDQIANWAIENQRFGGPDFNPKRMTGLNLPLHGFCIVQDTHKNITKLEFSKLNFPIML